MPNRIDLSEAELLICRNLGVMRRSIAMHKVKDQQMGNQDTWAIDIDGMVGEFCAAKFLNLCPDLTVGIRKGGADLVGHNGKTIDVKTTRHKDGRLLATLKKIESQCDRYVLVIVDDFGGEIIGWASKEKLFTETNKTNLGHGIGYALNQQQLNKFK
jgi:hypothetical protein